MNLKKKILRHRVFFIFLVLFLIGAVYYYWLYKEPYTQNAFVVANIRPVTTFVPGYVTNVYVHNNTMVRKGDKLFDIYKVPYELQVENIQNQLDAARHSLASQSYNLELLKFNINKANDVFANAKYLSDQARTLYNEDKAVAQKMAEQNQKAMEEAKEGVYMANEQLKIAEQTYQQTLSQVKSVDAQLRLAQLDLKWTTVYAQSDGIVTNMFLSPGTYVQHGSVLFAFIDTTTWWVQANFEETELSNIKEGQKAKIKLWQYPGKVFEGIVTATGWGVDRGSMSANGLPVIQQENQWFLLPQRFPVLIKIQNVDKNYQLHPGGTAWVRIETPALPIRQFFWEFFAL